MIREIIAEVYPWESRVGIIEDGRLAEVFWADQSENVGNIYKGKVKDVLPGLSCAFIDIGLVKNAFLYAGDVVLQGSRKGLNAFDLLKSGQDIMVQVKKEAFAEKGARVTGDLTIPGRFLVLLPFQNEVSISRKITDDQRRKHLRSIIEEHKPHGTGIILRTACLEAEDHEILADLRKLIQIWEEVNLRYNNHKSTSLIYEDIDVLERTLRDYLDCSISRVIINNPRLRERIIAYIDKQKAISGINVQFQEGDLFEKFGLEKDIRRSLRRKVWLKSGGYLIFDNTEAMTVIDVNSGKFTGKDDFEETIFKINVEAALEIPRQLRLRSLGGIILIDFIDMKDKSNEEMVISTLRSELEKDKAHTRIIGMTGLGFLEMTRKKSRYGVVEFFTDECSACAGKGYTLNLLALSCEVKRKLANMGYIESEVIVCEAHPRFLKLLKEDEKNLNYIEKRTGKKLNLLANPSLELTEYSINAGR
ncbi:MAG: Rne/Rng family ribonuclease [Syntrophomonadaceae bacterium]|nr:Rne/Rng family ribonuclease [Syntrophomonadaceae bacterium]